MSGEPKPDLTRDAEAFVRRAMAHLGQTVDDETVAATAAKIIRGLPKSVREAWNHRPTEEPRT